MKFDKSFVPNEIRQKDVIFTTLPWIQRPVTKRQLIALIVGFVLGVFVFISIAKIPMETQTRAKAFEWLVIRIMIALAVPSGLVIISTKEKDGKYLEERFFAKRKYKKTASIYLNKKASSYYKQKRGK